MKSLSRGSRLIQGLVLCAMLLICMPVYAQDNPTSKSGSDETGQTALKEKYKSVFDRMGSNFATIDSLFYANNTKISGSAVGANGISKIFLSLGLLSLAFSANRSDTVDCRCGLILLGLIQSTLGSIFLQALAEDSHVNRTAALKLVELRRDAETDFAAFLKESPPECSWVLDSLYNAVGTDGPDKLLQVVRELWMK